ncbi:MAG: hypothetical protein ACM3O3_13015 [Syntrophothermus sp.]
MKTNLIMTVLKDYGVKYEVKKSKCSHYYFRVLKLSGKVTKWYRVKKITLVNAGLLASGEIKSNIKKVTVNLVKKPFANLNRKLDNHKNEVFNYLNENTKVLDMIQKNTEQIIYIPDRVKNVIKEESQKLIVSFTKKVSILDLKSRAINKIKSGINQAIALINNHLVNSKIVKIGQLFVLKINNPKIPNKKVFIEEIILEYLYLKDFYTERTVLTDYISK